MAHVREDIGQFTSFIVGSVFLVTSTQTGKYYALKQIRVNERDLRTIAL